MVCGPSVSRLSSGCKGCAEACTATLTGVRSVRAVAEIDVPAEIKQEASVADPLVMATPTVGVLVSGLLGLFGGTNPTEVASDYVSLHVVSFVAGCTELKDALREANTERKDWAPYSEAWRTWKPGEAEDNRKSFVYAEYLWSTKKDKTFRARHMDTPAAKKLKELQSGSSGVIVEFFVTCAKGANVCQTLVTSDWYQGDEEKFTRVATTGLMFAAQPKRDDSVGKVGVQVSIPVMDDDGKTLLGVAILTVIPDAVQTAAAGE